MKLRSQHMIMGLILLLPAMGITACGALIQIIDVDVKLPAQHPLKFNNSEIAVFNALYDPVEGEGEVWNDSLLINKVAEGFRNRLAAELSIDPDSIPVYNHYCGQTACGHMEDKEYVYSLSEQTGARILVLIDSVRSGDFEHLRARTASMSEYTTTIVSSEWQMVFRFFDMESDRFIARFAAKDTLVWNIISKERDTLLINTKLKASLPETASYMGSKMAEVTQPQWETQERVLFLFSGTPWYKAMEHAFSFEWEEAKKIWLSLTKETKNTKKIAYAAYNLAVSSEMMGQFDLAREWLELARKYLPIPEIDRYFKMLEERKQQQRIIFLQ